MRLDAVMTSASPNFGFLAKRYPQLERIGAQSERYFSDDPIVSLITIRQFGEVLAQLVSARSGLFSDTTALGNGGLSAPRGLLDNHQPGQASFARASDVVAVVTTVAVAS